VVKACPSWKRGKKKKKSWGSDTSLRKNVSPSANGLVGKAKRIIQRRGHVKEMGEESMKG